MFYLWKLDWIFKVICSGWVNMTPPQNHHIGRRANPILIYKSLATYLNNSKSKKCQYNHIETDVISFFVASKGVKKNPKNVENH